MSDDNDDPGPDRALQVPLAKTSFLAQKAAARASRMAAKAARQAAFAVTGRDNVVKHGKRVQLSGFVEGDRNRIEIETVGEVFNLVLQIRGNDNVVRISENAAVRGLVVHIGNHVPAHGVRFEIGRNFSISRGGIFYLFNSGSSLTFGDDCLLSYDTVIRCGDSPHLIFDRSTGDYLDLPQSIVIGNRVWIGEGVYLGKRAGLADDTIVAARSVVTKRFDEPFVAVGGNPARIIRRDVAWVRNPGLLVPGSAQHTSYHAHIAQFDTAQMQEPEFAALPDPGPAAR